MDAERGVRQGWQARTAWEHALDGYLLRIKTKRALKFRRHMTSYRCRVVLLLLPMIGVCSPAAGKDMVCDEVAKFANASQDYSLHTVELITDWGGPLSEKEHAIYVMQCHDNHYAPGTKLCRYLLTHSNQEFAETNFWSALNCIGKVDIRQPPFASDTEYLNVKISSFSAQHVRPDIKISLEFSSATKDKDPSLRISVQRFKP